MKLIKRNNEDYYKFTLKVLDPPGEYNDHKLGIMNSVNFLLDLLEKLNKNIGNRVLDIGTRDGFTLDYLKEFGFDTIGIDIGIEHVRYARSRNRNMILGNICNIPFKDNTFDLTFSRHTIEHCEDIKTAIKEMHRVTIIGGIICCVFPLQNRLINKHYYMIPKVDSILNLELPGKLLWAGTDNKKQDEGMIVLKK